MFLRPTEVYMSFTVSPKTGGVNSRGRPTAEFQPGETPKAIKGVLAESSPDEMERWKQRQHPITHQIVQHGKAIAAEEDELLLDGTSRKFFIQGIVNPGNLDLFTIYYVEERRDA